MKTAPRTDDDCIVADPDLNTSEILPTSWAEYAEQRMPEPEIWICWRKFKAAVPQSRFGGWQREVWQKWVNSWVARKAQRQQGRAP